MQCFGQAKEHKADVPIRRVFGSTTKKSFHSSKRVPADQNSEAIRFRSGLNSSWPEIGNWPRLDRGKKPHSDNDFSGLGLTAQPLVEELSAGSELHYDPDGWSESICDSVREKSQKMKESPESLIS